MNKHFYEFDIYMNMQIHKCTKQGHKDKDPKTQQGNKRVETNEKKRMMYHNSIKEIAICYKFGSYFV
jgi:small nuclear ribonucleoprotein (snRNP)-like protein